MGWVARPGDLHRPLHVGQERLRDILCWREKRYVGRQLTLSYERKRVMLRQTDVTSGLVGQYVDVYAFADGRLEIRWKGVPLSISARLSTRRRRVRTRSATASRSGSVG